MLAGYARRLGGGRLPATLGGWYGAVAEYSGATEQKTAELLADDVFSTLRTGAYNSSMPDDHTVIRGKTVYYQIVLNHRLFYVNAADVVVKSLP